MPKQLRRPTSKTKMTEYLAKERDLGGIIGFPVGGKTVFVNLFAPVRDGDDAVFADQNGDVYFSRVRFDRDTRGRHVVRQISPTRPRSRPLRIWPRSAIKFLGRAIAKFPTHADA